MSETTLASLGRNSPVVLLEFTVPSAKISEKEFIRFSAEMKEAVKFEGSHESAASIWGEITQRVSLADFVKSLMVHYQIFDASISRNFNSPEESSVAVLFAWHGCKVGVSRKFKEKRRSLEWLIRRLSENGSWNLTGYSRPIASARMGDTSFAGGRMIALVFDQMTMASPKLDLKITSSSDGPFGRSSKTHALFLRGLLANVSLPVQPLTIARLPKEAIKMSQPKVTKVYVPMTPQLGGDYTGGQINDADAAFTTYADADDYKDGHGLGQVKELKLFTSLEDALSLEEEAVLQRELNGLSEAAKAILRKRGVAC